MLKVLLCINMIVSTFSITNNSEVKKIEYTSNDYKNHILSLKIDIGVNRRDIITLNIYFYKDKIKQEGYYNSSLILEKSSETIAKIPVEINEEMEMNVVVTSNNLNREISNVIIPLYPYKEEICILETHSVCTSKYPSVVSYKKNKISKEYETISLINDSLFFYSFDNLLPLNKVFLVTNLNITNEGYGVMNIEKYKLPISVSGNNIIELDLENKYYLDIKEGRTYTSYESNTIHDNNIIFPYGDYEYSINIELYDCFLSFNTVSISFVVATRNSFLGDCSSSVYCFRRVYL